MMTAGYTALAIAGAGVGTPFSGELNQQPGCIKSKLFSRVRSHPADFCFAWHQFVRQKKCFSLPNNKSNSNRSFALRKDADDNFLKNAEDVDEVFDDLFNKYGKVVFRSNDQRPSIAEVDDDAETLSFAVAVAKVASDVKAGDIKVLFVKPLVYWTRFFIIATAFSRPQIDAIASRIRDLGEKQYGKVPSGDTKPNSWTLLDFGDVVVHIFLPEQRDYYNLEEFYGNAKSIDLPFENQPPPFRG
ncbi:unnamed protein product [Linum trigynum]|uniref:Protein Iojap, chloroplastic n=2 Tax=Linum trigynum TaxID=586398 RepID=A0AAV2GFA8_9ROSI